MLIKKSTEKDKGRVNYFVCKIRAKPDISRNDSTNFCNADVINANASNNNASNVIGVSPDLLASP